VPTTLLRYFLKRWSIPLLGALVFYGGLSLANEMVQASREIFRQGASFRWLIPMLATTLPEILAMVLPMAAVLGGVLGTQNLSEGSEMVASQGLGVGLRSILKPWLILSALLVLFAMVNAHLIVPEVSVLQTQLKAQMIEATKIDRVRPGAAPWYLDGGNGDDVCVWVARTGEIHLMEASGDGVQHVVAKGLSWFEDQKAVENRSLILELNDIQGCLVQGSDRVSHLKEKSQRFKIPLPEAPRLLKSTPLRYLSTRQLFSMGTPASRNELCRRITLPISAAALLLFGIALGLSHPRFHKGGAILKSLGVILAYYLLLTFLDNRVLTGDGKAIIISYSLPIIFFGAGFWLLIMRLRPHHSSRLSRLQIAKYIRQTRWFRRQWILFRRRFRPAQGSASSRSPLVKDHPRILQRWTRRLWWRQWGAVLGTFLVLDLMMGFAELAGDLSKNKVSYWIFFQYWFYNLPTFLAIVFPVAFLLGGILAFTDAAQTREWTALRAGGTSLLQWVGSGMLAWAAVLCLTLVSESLLAPVTAGKQDVLYQRIKNRPLRSYQTRPWLHLGSTGVLWHLDGDHRWGFPLSSPGSGTPILLRWQAGDPNVEMLAWGGLTLIKGQPASTLFPDKTLLESGRMEETSTLDLFRWEKWAPDPERATLLWGRLFNWLAGPCLLFAMLSQSFPNPRGGRGKALGYGLVVGLLYLGMQALFGGAARSGEIPPLWGVCAPMFLMLGFGMLRLNRLRT